MTAADWGEIAPTWPAQILQALRDRWVRLGVLATALIVVGHLTPAYLPQNSPWWKHLRPLGLDGQVGKVGGTLLVLGGLALLVQSWLVLRTRIQRLAGRAILLLWSLPLLLAPPVFSHDAYSYAAQGWLVHNGLNPYDTGPGALPGAFADQAPWVWRFTRTPYGPLSLRIQALIVDASGLQPYVAAAAMRIPALVGVILIAALVPRIARVMRIDPHHAMWLGVLNPILVTDFVGGAHNDSLMVGLCVLAVWVAARHRRLILAGAIVGLGATIKQPALLTAYALPFVMWPLASRDRKGLLVATGRATLSCCVALASFAAISLATGFGFGWIRATGVPGSVVTISPFTVIGSGIQWLLDAASLDPTGHLALSGARSIGLLVALVIVAYLALVRVGREPMTFLSWSYLAIALCGPALHGWYMMWGMVFLPLARPNQSLERLTVWVSALLLGYAAINFSWRNGSTALGVLLLALLCWQVVRAHRMENEEKA